MKNTLNFALAVIILFGMMGCKKEAAATAEPVTKTEIAAENLVTAHFTIEGMTCEIGCAKTIESKLAAAEGVGEAKVDFESKIATVTFDKAKQSIASLGKTIENVGGGALYKVTNAEKNSAN